MPTVAELALRHKTYGVAVVHYPVVGERLLSTLAQGLGDNYTRQVEDAVRHYQWYRGIYSDGVGVYGPDTRRRLESETREP